MLTEKSVSLRTVVYLPGRSGGEICYIHEIAVIRFSFPAGGYQFPLTFVY
jgi:hypothetical protein